MNLLQSFVFIKAKVKRHFSSSMLSIIYTSMANSINHMFKEVGDLYMIWCYNAPHLVRGLVEMGVSYMLLHLISLWVWTYLVDNQGH
jgi:hypothetical protein